MKKIIYLSFILLGSFVFSCKKKSESIPDPKPVSKPIKELSADDLVNTLGGNYKRFIQSLKDYNGYEDTITGSYIIKKLVNGDTVYTNVRNDRYFYPLKEKNLPEIKIYGAVYQRDGVITSISIGGNFSTKEATNMVTYFIKAFEDNYKNAAIYGYLADNTLNTLQYGKMIRVPSLNDLKSKLGENYLKVRQEIEWHLPDSKIIYILYYPDGYCNITFARNEYPWKYKYEYF